MSVVLCSRNLCGHLRIELLFFNKKGFFMNIVLIYTIKEAESGRSIAAFLLNSGYSSRLVVHLRNTEGSFLLN